MKIRLITILLLFSIAAYSQHTQTITGIVTDGFTHDPLIGAYVILVGTEDVGTITDYDGRFELKDIPIGRISLKCSYTGYETIFSPEFVLTSAREEFLELTLYQASVGIKEIVVFADETKPINSLSYLSSRSFSVEETERIPAGVNDPGRMALAFPGVQQSGSDELNEIIIRGNSPFGLTWRLEGVDMVNPNHFARPGTSGGGVTVFSAQLLSRSDFFIGALPANYGDALSGVFDMHFRKGNDLSRAHRIKIGLLGLDFATEGPIKKGRSSYLVNYRYSTLGLLNKFGLHIVGERVSNEFQDLSFNLAFKSKDAKNTYTVFGVGGLSYELDEPVYPAEDRDPLKPDHAQLLDLGSDLGVLGFTFTRSLKNGSLKAVLAGSRNHIFRDFDTLNVADDRFRYNEEKYLDYRLSTNVDFNWMLKGNTRLKTGYSGQQIFYDFYKNAKPRNDVSATLLDEFPEEVLIDGQGSAYLMKAYALIQRPINKKIEVNGGVHILYLPLNGSFSPEPRFALNYSIDQKHAIALAYGLQSKILPLSAYFFTHTDTTQSGLVSSQPNMDLKPIKTHHFGLAYTFSNEKRFRFNVETYFQRLFNVPVRPTETGSVYWMLNTESVIPSFALISEGTGNNYGTDITLEKSFSQNIYFLLTGSLSSFKYGLPSGETYNTRFDTRYISTLTLGKEFEFKKGNSSLQVGAKLIFNGGFRYTPFDETASANEGRYVPDLDQAWSEQIDPYFRIDSRIMYRFNKKKFSGSIALDIQNITDKVNPQGVGYNPYFNALEFKDHPSGFIPVLSFQADF